MSLTSERVRGMGGFRVLLPFRWGQASVPGNSNESNLTLRSGFLLFIVLRTDQREHDSVFTLLSPSNPVANGNSAQRWGAKEKRS